MAPSQTVTKLNPGLYLTLNPAYCDTVNPLLSPPRGLFILSPFEVGGGGGDLIETEGLFNLETTMVLVLHKELEYKEQDVFGHAAEDQNQIRTSSWYINHPGEVNTKLYSRD